MALIENLDFGDVSSDTDFTNKAIEINSRLLKIQEHIQLSEDKLANMSIEDRINYKLFIVYAVNTLCWIQLRFRGVDPNTHPVKQQLSRIRQLMQKKDEIIEKKNRPVLDKDAAKRFVRSGLWDPKNKELLNGPANKKIKFSDS